MTQTKLTEKLKRLSKQQPTDSDRKYEVFYMKERIGVLDWDKHEKAFCANDMYLLKSPQNIQWRLHND